MRLVSMIKRWGNSVRGFGEYAVTVPSMEGALQPNNELEDAGHVLRKQGVDNILDQDGEVYFSAGRDIFKLDALSGQGILIVSLNDPILAMLGWDGHVIIVALDSGVLLAYDTATGTQKEIVRDKPFQCITGLDRADDHTIAVSCGAVDTARARWKFDLLRQGNTGAVFTVNLDTGETKRIAKGLRWAGGIAATADNNFVVTESWSHRLVRIGPQGKTETLLEDLPGYPSRITRDNADGWWLILFAPRNQLVEFVIRESKFKSRMMAEVDERFWICPTYSLTGDFREPMQGGAMKSMGIRKPWAPSLSYGLVCRLDDNFAIVWSAHSRASGKRHGATSCLQTGKHLLVSCAANGGEIVRVALPNGEPHE